MSPDSATNPATPLTSGIDTTELDSDIRPQDDLFRHVNGKWIERTAIPDDKARYGSFHILAEEAEKAVRDIIVEGQTAAPGTEERKFGDLYASFLDQERVEKHGAEPLRLLLAEVDAVASVDQFLMALGGLERRGTNGFFQLFVDNDPGNPERYLVFLEQGGLGLPDESYYREEKFADIRAAYLSFVEKMLALAGVTDAEARTARIVALETEIAAQHWDNVRTRDSDATYNLTTWSQVPGFDLWLDALDVPEGALDELVVREPSFVEGLRALIDAEHLQAWTDWLRWQVIRSNAAYLSSEFVAANFDFYGKTLTGTPELRARW